METLPKFGMSRADMLKRVARFKELKGSDGGLPDSKAPQCERTLYNVIGFVVLSMIFSENRYPLFGIMLQLR